MSPMASALAPVSSTAVRLQLAALCANNGTAEMGSEHQSPFVSARQRLSMPAAAYTGTALSAIVMAVALDNILMSLARPENTTTHRRMVASVAASMAVGREARALTATLSSETSESTVLLLLTAAEPFSCRAREGPTQGWPRRVAGRTGRGETGFQPQRRGRGQPVPAWLASLIRQ